MNLENLKKEIPFKWRVQSSNQYGASCVAYIDARDVQDLLDEVCGQDGWQCKYSEHKGNLFCSIGILQPVMDKNTEWVWKEDCGTESNVEKQKGEASDAFKRAAVMWGAGRFLYSKKIVKIKEVIKDKRGKFIPAQNGKQIWDITKYCNELTYKSTIPIKKKLNDEQFDRFLLQDKKTIQSQKFDFNFTEDQKNIIELTLKID